jgi:uncharacterized protein
MSEETSLLSEVEIRVLGCLMEKAVTTPEYYPLTLNALVNACNQKSNRDPVMYLTEHDVENALESLRFSHRLVTLVHTSGSRVHKFKHTITDRYAISEDQQAVLCELFLRGPQTVGELRGRAARLFAFDSLEAVEKALDDLMAYAGGPLVAKLPREAGRRESRYAQLLGDPPDLTAQAEHVAERTQSSPPPSRYDVMQAEVKTLREEMDRLKTEWAEFKRQFE